MSEGYEVPTELPGSTGYMKLLYTVQYNVMYKYIFYHALYSVRVSISYYVLHVAMLVLLIDYSSKYKSYASEPFLYSGTATQ